MNGFDRVLEGDENWLHGHRSLPSTPEQHTGSLRSDLIKLKDAISMPDETETRPRQKTRMLLTDSETIPWTSCLQISNLQESRNTWKGGAAKRRRGR